MMAADIAVISEAGQIIPPKIIPSKTIPGKSFHLKIVPKDNMFQHKIIPHKNRSKGQNVPTFTPT